MSRAQQLEQRAQVFEAVAAAARKMRAQLEGFRAEYAKSNDLAHLLACATVSDQLDEWEAYEDKAASLRRKLRRNQQVMPGTAGTGGAAAGGGR